MSKHPIRNYTVLKVIGKGAFAIVYQGQHVKTKEIVAIKQINIDMEEGPHKAKMMELFNQEITIMSQVKHKNIVDLKEVQHTPDAINMILEYCGLGDLEKYIKKNSVKNRLPESEAKPIILQLLDAMKILRLKNVVHRDLKLANILINEQMQIKLGDFGFAKFPQTELLESYCGTPITMAPEILKKNDTYDYKCDIWSLGVMIYQILFGAPPFVPQRGTVQDLIIAIQTQKLQFPQHISVSAECKDLLRKMLVEDPNKRTTFEEIFRHPWCFAEQIDLTKSVLKAQVPQHSELLKNLAFTLNQHTLILKTISTKVQQLEQKYPDLEPCCVRFKNSLNNAFNSIQLRIAYSNQVVNLKIPEKGFKLFDLQQEILFFLADVYEIAIKQKLNVLEVLSIKVDYEIRNFLSLTYEEYTVTLQDELQNFKISNIQQGQMLQLIEDNQRANKFQKSDLQILTECIMERCQQ